jgi:hypothetical protein
MRCPSPRKHGLELSRDGSPCESRGRSAGRRARPDMARSRAADEWRRPRTLVCACAVNGRHAPFGASPPSFVAGGEFYLLRRRQGSDIRTCRERGDARTHFTSPRRAGRGWVRGLSAILSVSASALSARLRPLTPTLSPQAGRRSEMIGCGGLMMRAHTFHLSPLRGERMGEGASPRF